MSLESTNDSLTIPDFDHTTLRDQLAERDKKIADLEARLAAAEAKSGAPAPSAAPAQLDAKILQRILENMGDGVVAFDTTGQVLITNALLDRYFVTSSPDTAPEDVSKEQGVFYPDEETYYPLDQYPHIRALYGESSRDVEMFVRNHKVPDGVYLSTTATPLRGDDGTTVIGSVALFRDVTEQKLLEKQLEERNEALQSSEREKADLIDKLRMAIEEVSTPILEIWDDVLALPIIGVVDSRRSAHMTDRLLREVVARRTRIVVLDVTGMEVIDTATADHFLQTVRSIELLGARCVLSGISPAVARTLVTLGVDLNDVRTYGTLKHALRASLSHAESGKAWRSSR